MAVIGHRYELGRTNKLFVEILSVWKFLLFFFEIFFLKKCFRKKKNTQNVQSGLKKNTKLGVFKVPQTWI